MPNKDWYWDRFEVDVKSDKLDLSDAQTSAIRGNKKIDDDTANKYETQFIDDLYGTKDRAWSGDKAPYDNSTYDGVLGEDAEDVSGGVTWGLDLVRDWTDHDFEKDPVGSDAHYEHQTRGKVDWAHYYDDNAYQSAFKDYRNAKDSGPAADFTTLEDYLTDRSHDAPTTSQRVDFLDYAKTHEAKDKDDDGGLPDTWDNKYVDQFDPDTATPYQATYLDVPDLWGESKGKSDWETPDTPISVVKPASIPTLDNIKRRQVEVPDSIKHFGEAKSAPTNSFKPGGGGE